MIDTRCTRCNDPIDTESESVYVLPHQEAIARELEVGGCYCRLCFHDIAPEHSLLAESDRQSGVILTTSAKLLAALRKISDLEKHISNQDKAITSHRERVWELKPLAEIGRAGVEWARVSRRRDSMEPNDWHDQARAAMVKHGLLADAFIDALEES